jgi:hypothetical protein
MKLYGIIYNLISLKRREKKREGREGAKKKKEKKKERETKGKEKFYLFNEYVSE